MSISFGWLGMNRVVTVMGDGSLEVCMYGQSACIISLVALTFLNECVDNTATSSIVAPLR